MIAACRLAPDLRSALSASRDRYAAGMPTRTGRPLRTAEILSIGSELTVGETRDTNAGELAAALTAEGVASGGSSALPDRLDVVSERVLDGLRARRPRREHRWPRTHAR